MAEYQNIFTQVQVATQLYPGVPLRPGRGFGPGRPVLLLARKDRRCADRSRLSRLPRLGVDRCAASSRSRSSVSTCWRRLTGDPIEFVRQLPWLSLDPPKPEYGLRSSAAAGRRLVADGGLLPHHLDPAVVGEDLPAGAGARHGYACVLGVRFGDLAVSGARLHPPVADGQIERGRAVRDIPASRLDQQLLPHHGNLFYNPFHMLSIAFLYGSALLFAMHGATILAVSRYGGEREIEQIVDRGTASERGRVVLALDDGVQRDGWNRSIAGPGGLLSSAR